MTQRKLGQTGAATGAARGIQVLRAIIQQTPCLVEPAQEWAAELAADIFAAQRFLRAAGELDAAAFEMPVEVLVLVPEGIDRWVVSDDTLRRMLLLVLTNDEAVRVVDRDGHLEILMGTVGWTTDGRPVKLLQSISETPDPLSAILDAIDPALAEVRERFEAWLAMNEGAGGPVPEKKRIASLINEIAARLQLAIACPQVVEGRVCGHPARIRCTPGGLFQFDHVIAGERTSHGGSPALPRLRLIRKPPDRRKTVLAEEPSPD